MDSEFLLFHILMISKISYDLAIFNVSKYHGIDIVNILRK